MVELVGREAELREFVCEIGRRLWQRGLIAAYEGNISVRMGDGRILCTPTGLSKGFLKVGDLVVIDGVGRIISGVRGPSSEIKMHLALYEERPDLGAVVHAHPPVATAFALAGVGLPEGAMPEIDGLLGRVELLDYVTPGTSELADGFRGPARSGSNVFLLGRHGATAAGKDLEEAWFRMEGLEACCRALKASREITHLWEQ